MRKYLNIKDFDGDQVYCIMLKEMAEVIKYMAIHPMTTLLSGTGGGLTNDVKITNEYTLACNRWLFDPDQFVDTGPSDTLVVGST